MCLRLEMKSMAHTSLQPPGPHQQIICLSVIHLSIRGKPDVEWDPVRRWVAMTVSWDAGCQPLPWQVGKDSHAWLASSGQPSVATLVGSRSLLSMSCFAKTAHVPVSCHAQCGLVEVQGMFKSPSGWFHKPACGLWRRLWHKATSLTAGVCHAHTSHPLYVSLITVQTGCDFSLKWV